MISRGALKTLSTKLISMKLKSALTILLQPILFICLYAQQVEEMVISETNKLELPYSRIIQPAGKQIHFGDPQLENHALDCALSPDEKWLVVEERFSLLFINTSTNQIAYTLVLSDIPGINKGLNTYSGICWSFISGNNYVFWSAIINSQSVVFQARWDGVEAKIVKQFNYRPKRTARTALPNEIAVTRESGDNFLYVVLNGNNQIIKQNLETGDTTWIQPTGVAPYGLTLANSKIYVTNWGGRMPESGDKNIAGVPWGVAKVDEQTGATREGSVSVYDPSTGELLKEVVVGLHPNEIISDRKGKLVFVTNSNSDNVSVIETNTDEVVETISVRLQKDINDYFGDSPQGIGISRNGKTLYVANGMDNALAVVSVGKHLWDATKMTPSQVIGFIPTGAYPSSVSISQDRRLFVTNLESEGANLPLILEGMDHAAFNAHHMYASISIIDVPNKKALQKHTETVIATNAISRSLSSKLVPRENVKPKPIPERIGEPSVFKHVLYIIKENRTYDQVLGDMAEGKGDSVLCIFPEQVTPNTHALARRFGLLDNYHVSGKSSAEGHQWTDAAIVTDYVEKNMRAWFRSYPHVQTDALVYAPTGFLWDNATRHGKSVKIYGEACIPEFDDNLKWADIYQGYLNKEPFEFHNITTIAPVRDLLSITFPGYDHHAIPDVLRADAFIKELKDYESMEGDQLPELMIMALPNDHTAGTRPDYPTPRAMVADNDLALGQIVEAVSKSRFWENTLILVTEDDSQAGWDHVSAYRTVGLAISAYSKKGATIHTNYNQPSMVRTIEQVLGIPPMNIQDAIAEPMADCFTDTPDYTPYEAISNEIALDEMNPPLTGLNGRALHFALKSMEPQFEHIDAGDDDLLNRILWFSAKGHLPYPSKYDGKADDDDD
jgi:YVTN family beta-propeller protein